MVEPNPAQTVNEAQPMEKLSSRRQRPDLKVEIPPVKTNLPKAADPEPADKAAQEAEDKA